MFKPTKQQTKPLPTKPQPKSPLVVIEECHAVLEEYLEKRIDEMKQESPGVPRSVLRRLLENRAAGCLCRQVKNEIEGL
jgi:hypothetical protein